MKLTKFLSIVTVAIISLSLSGCNKDPDPIILTGSWQLDPTATFLQIYYNSSYASEYPSAIQFLKDNKDKILKEIKKPEIIQFVAPNTVNFIYEASSSTPPVVGTFEQFEIYVNIKNPIFPNGLTGASNNQKLEIYYSKEYMMSILYSILTPADDTQETFSNLIEGFDGVGVYVRPSL
ncbi:MAG: hypothetical protein ABFC28_03490 [Rikenellaceae bacterium]